MDRQNISTGTPFEAAFGFSRAVRVGNIVHVSGTAAVDEKGQLVGGDDMYAQTVFILQKIERALHEAGSSLADVVRTRIFITDMSGWEAISRAHHEFFAEIRPAATLVEVSALIRPDLLVEIEVDAIIQV
jgi:enamine deaminase RidA (YjgF/YER057c/UK114 family)